jgi:hypothetical protein
MGFGQAFKEWGEILFGDLPQPPRDIYFDDPAMNILDVIIVIFVAALILALPVAVIFGTVYFMG